MKYAILTAYNVQELSGGGHSLRKVIKAIELIDSNAQICLIQRSSAINDDDKYWNFRSITVQKSYRKTKFHSIISRMILYPNFMNLYSRQIMLDVLGFNPDFIFFIGTRFGKVFREITNRCPEAAKKTYVQVENFELGMIDNTKSVMRKIFSGIERRSIIRSEKEMINADRLIFLTKEDKENFEEFYGNIISKCCSYKNWVIPHCYDQELSYKEIIRSIDERYEKLQREKEVQMLFTGSFSLQSNIQAVYNILKFMNSISAAFKNIGFNVKYTVAGYNAKMFANMDKRLTVINRPTQSELQSIFRNSDIYISLVTMGPGINTKIAEALSYGLPIVVERYSLRGYDELLNNSHDFVFDINHFSERIANDLISNYQLIRLHSYNFFKNNYSISVFAESIKKIIEEG